LWNLQKKEPENNAREKHDLLVCPNCGFTLVQPWKSPLGRYQENWKGKAETLFPLLRPALSEPDLENPRLFFLYEDCYQTLLIGR
jgi:hypothetical protein